MAKKWLYEFNIKRETEIETREKSTNEDGKEIEVLEKVKKKLPVGFLIQKPTRKLFDEAELFYGVKMSEGIKAGLLTRNLLAKRYEDDGGAFSEAEKERYSELYLAIYNKEEEYQRLQLNLDNKAQELKDKLAEALLLELSDLRRELADIENAQSNIFDQTAENRAKNQTIMWWVLRLSHWKEHDHNNPAPFFGEGDYDAKLEQYDVYEEGENEFYGEAIRKLAYFISFWYMGRATSKEDFKTVENLYNEELGIEEGEEKSEEETAEDSSEKPKPKTKKKPAKKTKATTKKKPKVKKAKKTKPDLEEEEAGAEKTVLEEAVAEEAVAEEAGAEEAVAEEAGAEKRPATQVSSLPLLKAAMKQDNPSAALRKHFKKEAEETEEQE